MFLTTTKTHLFTPPQLRSEVWKNFGFRVDEKGEIIDNKSVVCRKCKGKVAYSGNTTNLSTHLRKCTAYLTAQPKIGDFYPAKDKMMSTDPRATVITNQLVKSIVKHMVPIKTGVDLLTDVLGVAVPNYAVPQRTKVTRMIEESAEEKRASLKEELKTASKVCISMDFWTSVAQESYMGTTIHFIDAQWMLQSRALEVYGPVTESHTATNIASLCRDLEARWEIEGKVMCYVTDNAANVVKAIETELKANLIRCHAHSIQLSVMKGLGSRQITNLTAKCRRIVGHFRHSPKAMHLLFEAQLRHELDKRRLVQDVPTRWNSTLDMIVSIRKSRVAINDVLRDNISTETLCITMAEMGLIQALEEVLTPFKDATEQLGAESYVTASVAPTILKNLRSCVISEARDPLPIKDVKTLIKNDLDDRINNIGTLTSIAAALDPRYRQLRHLSTDQQKDDVWNVIRDECLAIKMAEDAKLQAALGVDEEEQADEPTPTKKKCLTQEDSDDDEEEEETNLTKIDREIGEYRKISKVKDVEVLSWWNANKTIYPVLSQVAKNYLCFVATSVPCERMFSKAGGTVTKSRNRLTGSHVNDLVFLNDYYKQNQN